MNLKIIMRHLTLICIAALVTITLFVLLGKGESKSSLKNETSGGKSYSAKDLPREEFDYVVKKWNALRKEGKQRMVSPYLWGLNRCACASIIPVVLGAEQGGRLELCDWVEQRLAALRPVGLFKNSKEALSAKATLPYRIKVDADRAPFKGLRDNYSLKLESFPKGTVMPLLETELRLVISDNWKREFDCCKTGKGDFYYYCRALKRTTETSVTYMGRKIEIPIFFENDIVAVSLRFKKSANLRFLAIMDKSPVFRESHWDDLLKYDYLWRVVNNLEKGIKTIRCMLFIPKFEVKRAIRSYVGKWVWGCFKASLAKDRPFPVLMKEKIQFKMDEGGISLKVVNLCSVYGVSRNTPIVKFDHPFLYFLLDIKKRIVFLLGEFLGPQSIGRKSK